MRVTFVYDHSVHVEICDRATKWVIERVVMYDERRIVHMCWDRRMAIEKTTPDNNWIKCRCLIKLCITNFINGIEFYIIIIKPAGRN